MRKVILDDDNHETVRLSVLNLTEPIFAKKNGELRGMLVEEANGWICRTGGNLGVSGHHTTVVKCMVVSMGFGYEFFVN